MNKFPMHTSNSSFRYFRFTILLLIIFCSRLAAQDSTALPATDIFLLDISKDKKGNLQFQNPVRITKNENYDNEPWFYPDGSAILYASVNDSSAGGDSSKSDIYKYDLRTQKTSVVINTPKMAEFSPMIPPNKAGISVVQVLEDDSTQILARCDDKTDECVNLLPKQKKVAYYIWIDASRVAYMVLGDPMPLLMTNLATGKTDTLADDVGRCLQKVPGKNLQISFVDKGSNPWTIKTYDGKSGKISSVVETMEDQEDYCYMPDGSLLMGNRSELYHYTPPEASANSMASAHTTSSTHSASSHATPANSKNSPANSKGQPAKQEKPKEEKAGKKGTGPWQQVATFKGSALYQFYRLAVSPKGDKLAVVTFPDDKP